MVACNVLLHACTANSTFQFCPSRRVIHQFSSFWLKLVETELFHPYQYPKYCYKIGIIKSRLIVQMKRGQFQLPTMVLNKVKMLSIFEVTSNTGSAARPQNK